MGRAAPELYDLAGRILAEEARGSLQGVELADVAERAYKKLLQHMSLLIGSYATHLLLRRAFGKTVEEYPFLKDVEVESDGRLKGLREKVEKPSHSEVRAGLAMILANFISLLNDFIGEDMVLYLLQNAWPGVMSGQEGSRQEGEI